MVYLLFFCTHYPYRGGNSALSARCGAFCVHDGNGASTTAWHYGAALSFKLDKIHIILIVVVLLAMVLIVEFSVFVPTLLFLILSGALALLYRYTLYFSWW